MAISSPPAWLLLVHQLPPRPLYLRAKVRQRLAKVGAVALKNSVYVLPDLDETREDFAWIAQEARAGGGDAFVVRASFLEGVSAPELVTRFRKERDADYEALVAAVAARGAPRKGLHRETAGDPVAALARARRRLTEIRAIDFFEAPKRKEAEAMIDSRERELRRHPPSPAKGRASRPLRGRVWVTRRGIKVDRIASAWLVRRFLDPAARFRFVDPEKDAPRAGELRFDMAGGDFTHEGERCTFETLLLRAGLSDPALVPIAEIVHDVDLKDGKFGRTEAEGVKRLVDGIVGAHAADAARLERGLGLFDDLYASFRAGTPPKRARRSRS